jgi:hypothetical protein
MLAGAVRSCSGLKSERLFFSLMIRRKLQTSFSPLEKRERIQSFFVPEQIGRVVNESELISR